MSKNEAAQPLGDQQAGPARDRPDLIGNAPWWIISAGVHVAILLMATLVCIEKYTTVDEGGIVIHQMDRPQPVLAEVVRPEDRPGSMPRPTDDATVTRNETEASIIFHKPAEIGDPPETNNPDRPDLHGAFGDPTGTVGRRKTPSEGIEVIGPGPGAGGRGPFGRPDRSGREDRNPGGKSGVGPEETCAQGALAWLARHQSPDGSWRASGFTDQCHGARCGGAGVSDYDTGVTGLALLTFLGAGYTQLSLEGQAADLRNPGKLIRYRDVVKKAIYWLIANQDADGCVGPKVSKMMYNHSIAALALAEAYGMTESHMLKDPAQRAIDYLTAAKNPYKAWRYTSKCGENDASVTGWCVMALKSAKASSLQVSEVALHEANDWMKSVTETNYGKVGYTDLAEAGVHVAVPGKNEKYANHEALGAVGMMTRIFVDTDRSDPVLALTATRLSEDLPVWDKAKFTNDYYYWYYATLALFQYDGPDSQGGGKFWTPWNAAIQRVLTKNQHTRADGCAEGSWDADDRWGFEGGRVYAVAINALTMEVYQRYPNAFGVQARGKKRE